MVHGIITAHRQFCELIVVASIHTVKWPNGVAQKVWDRPSEYRRSIHDGDLVRV